MRPRLIDYIDEYLFDNWATYVVPTGTTMYVIAMLVVMYVYVKRCKRTDLSEFHALGTCIYGLIGGLLGARIFYLLETLPETLKNPEVILNIFGGTTSWGVYIGGLGGYFIYLKLNHLPVRVYADVMAASLGLGPFIGRWSCFLHGCCYGTSTDLSWAVHYPSSSPLFWHQVKQGILPVHTTLSTGVHPLPVYLSLSALFVFICTSFLWHKYRSRPGMTFLFYWFMYCSLRLIWEYFRGNAVRWDPIQLDLGQILCIPIILITGFLLFRFYITFSR